jgi:hypothetical protein
LFVTVPGQRWEVDGLSDGSLVWERFVSDGHLLEEQDLKQQIGVFAEPSD